jgi:hypothetical protein
MARTSRRRYPLERIIIGAAVLSIAFLNMCLPGTVHVVDNNPTNSPRPTQKLSRPLRVLRQPTPTPPIFVVGLPKVGTTSIHNMFACSGVASSHYCCCGSNRTHTHCNDIVGHSMTMSNCIQTNLKAKKPILEGCGAYTVYAQMDAEFAKSESQVTKCVVAFLYYCRWKK